MVRWLNTKRYSPIGVELGTRSVQLIQFTSDYTRLVDAARWDLPARDHSSWDELYARDLAEALGEAREGRRFRGSDAVVSLNARELFVQNIRVPKGAASELARTVQQEAASRVPFPIAEAELRYLSAGDVRQGDQIKREVILLACHRPVLDQVLTVVEQGGLRAIAIDIEPAALLRSYVKQFRRDEDRDLRTMFVRISASNTTVVIAQGDETYFVKYIDVGGEQLDEAVSRHLSMPLDEASKLRRHNGDRRADQQDPDIAQSISAATRSVVERLVSELSLCVRYHSVTFRGQTLARIILGGTEAVPGLADVLTARLDLKCQLGDPLRSYECSLPSSRRGQWDVAAGLALREIKG